MIDTAHDTNAQVNYLRSDGGRFATGNRGGPGRPPMTSAMGRFREALWSEIKENDIASAEAAVLQSAAQTVPVASVANTMVNSSASSAPSTAPHPRHTHKSHDHRLR